MAEILPAGSAAPIRRERVQLSEEVAGYARELIISGKVKPGEFLRTDRIAADLSVSNTPVREGLAILAGEGLVELIPRRGCVVAEFGRQDVRDIFWAQASLAAELCRRSAENITPADITRLEENVAEHAAAVDSGADDDTIIALGHEFHRIINLSAHSTRLARMLRGVVNQLPGTFYLDIEGHSTDSVRAHPEIVAALRNRQSRTAAELMNEHIMSGADDLIATLEHQGLWADADASE